MPAELRTERRGATLVLTFSAPATRNRLNDEVVASAIEALSVAESDPGVCCIVLRGDGGHFCAGSEAAPDAVEASAAQLVQFVEALGACPKPVVAAVEGRVAGAGLALVLACDLRVVAEDAHFVRPGPAGATVADAMAEVLFARALPRSLALQWLWLDEAEFVRQWLACGGINRHCPAGRAFTEACAIAERLEGVPASALASAKELVDEDAVPGLARRLAEARTWLARHRLRG